MSGVERGGHDADIAEATLLTGCGHQTIAGLADGPSVKRHIEAQFEAQSPLMGRGLIFPSFSTS
jgi:hypothetical protein